MAEKDEKNILKCISRMSNYLIGLFPEKEGWSDRALTNLEIKGCFKKNYRRCGENTKDLKSSIVLPSHRVCRGRGVENDICSQ